MDPNESQPGGPSNRTVTIHLTRDTLILIAALIFLGFAILLAIIFPAGSSGTPTPAPTSVAQGLTPIASPRATTFVPILSPTSGTAQARSPVPTLSEGLDGYPQPEIPTPFGEDTSAEATAAALARQTSIASRAPSSGLPTFAPARPTSALGATTGPTIAGGGLQQPSPYPPPGGATNTPTEELFTPIIPTPTREPTSAPLPTRPRPTRAPAPPAEPPPTAAPTAIPIDVLRGSLHWTPAHGPIILTRDQRLVAGASLVIEPGTEVRLAPGVSFFVQGSLYALGQPGQPVRFVGSEEQRWEGMFGQPGSNITLEHTEISGGGAGGTLLTSDGGTLVLHNDQVGNNGGHIAVHNSHLEVRDTEISGNDMPYGAALEATYDHGGFVTLTGNRIGGNRMVDAAAPVQINNQSSDDAVNLDIQRNLLIGQQGPDLVLFQDGPFRGGLDITLPNAGPFLGSMTCNALLNGSNGLSVRSNTTQVPPLALTVRDNAIEDHIPPVPIYASPYHGIGRGATSEITLDMSNNWWNSPLGPYEPDRNADGRGDAVGDMITFAPWLTARPACAPRP